MTQVKTIRIDDVEYVRADSIKTDAPAETLDGKPFVIVRSYGAGVFAGYFRSKEDTLGGRVVTLGVAKHVPVRHDAQRPGQSNRPLSVGPVLELVTGL